MTALIKRSKVIEEIQQVRSDRLDFDQVGEMKYLGWCLKESLRLKPPIICLMRKVLHDQQYKGFVIPKDDYICTSPVLNQIDEKYFPDAQKFKPERFSGEGATERSSYTPFGGGRHRCIGEPFAEVQVWQG